MLRSELKEGLSRRSFVKASGSVLVITGTALVHTAEAWGLEPKGFAPGTIQTLIRTSRDIYPHDRLADRFYALAVKEFDTKAAADGSVKTLFEEGVAKLDDVARAAHGVAYAEIGWEDQRVALLKTIEATPFFQSLRSGLVTGLYNQKEIWPLFGYEGESFSKGGYIRRGFNDIEWI